MRKALIAFVVIAFLGAMRNFGQDQDFSKVEMKVQKVAGTVYMLEGAGGNIGASVGDDGIVIVDDEFLPLADKIEAALKGISDKPIKVVLNTHWHGDHTGGNPHFGEKAPIVAQENVNAWPQAASPASAKPSPLTRAPCRSLPLKTRFQFT